jgi:hypothetical protein
MLHEFLSLNRQELISRCRGKVSKRASPPATPAELEHGVPLFLAQLIEALRAEHADPAARHSQNFPPAKETPASRESARTAALHGKELLEGGYTVEQVVHDYGDICQSLTELAKEKNAPVTVDEFHTLNRLLDNAIADAVSSYGQHRDDSLSSLGDQSLHERMATLAEAQRQLLDTALKALDALKVGNIGVMGATGTLLEDSLRKLRDLIDKSLPEIRLSSGMTAPPAGALSTGEVDRPKRVR